MGIFKLCAPYRPTGDQPKAIEALSHGINSGQRHQTLLGVTGSGKTFTMANVIAETSRPTLVIAHNKTLAAQLCGEFKEFFPENAVEFFVSYYDYYQPEAYLPVSDTYIAKDASINDEIEKLRHSATAALLERRDVIIVASVSAIYGLGDPADYLDLTLSCSVGASLSREEILRRLVGMQYKRNEVDFSRGTFRSKGEVVDIFPAGYSDKAVRIQLFGDEVEKICEIDVLTGEVLGRTNHAMIFPASHYATGEEKMKLAAAAIREELDDRLAYLRGAGKLLEAQRLEQRTHFDLEMMEEMGYCSGIENYSRHLAGREAGSPPYTLLDYFPEDYIIMIDESHATLPQIGAMYEGDRSRKASLVEYGFRLPSAIDNRPLTFAEFESRARQLIYISATPADYERRHSGTPVEQVVRPTGLIDPAIEIRPVKGQIDDLLEQIRLDTDKGGRVLVTTLTKRMAEDLTEFLKAAGVRVRYLHSDINTLERMSIVRELRLGNFDVLVGINLLREGLDLPEVTLVAILDADKEGFLRSGRSLIQTIGRAARNIEGRVVLYADRITDSMRSAIGETERRREIQQEFNLINGIVPRSVKKDVRDVIASIIPEGGAEIKPPRDMTRREREKLIASLEKQMRQASQKLEFEQAAELRDLIIELKAGV